MEMNRDRDIGIDVYIWYTDRYPSLLTQLTASSQTRNAHTQMELDTIYTYVFVCTHIMFIDMSIICHFSSYNSLCVPQL
jgi:hypothetical protein